MTAEELANSIYETYDFIVSPSVVANRFGVSVDLAREAINHLVFTGKARPAGRLYPAGAGPQFPDTPEELERIRQQTQDTVAEDDGGEGTFHLIK